MIKPVVINYHDLSLDPIHSTQKTKVSTWQTTKTMTTITYMSTQRERFEGQNGGPPSEARRASEGGSGGPPPDIFKNLYCKWCNLRYFLAIFVNTISLYYNKTCINRKLNYAKHFACTGSNVNEINAKTLLRKLAHV